MIPKFTNPHLGVLVHATQPVTRAEIFKAGEDEEGTDTVEDPGLVKQLEKLVRRSLKHKSSDDDDSASRRKKRRKTEDDAAVDAAADSGLPPFRLISTTLPPLIVSLEPPPPPPSITREPPAEDTPEEAARRTRRAFAAAVDYERVIEASLDRHQSASHARVVHGSLPAPAPALLLIELTKPTNRLAPAARHPAAFNKLAANPHTARLPPSTTVLTLTAEAPPPPDWTQRRKRVRGKQSKADRQRPRPAFWQPPPGCRGKAVGYAMGYPSYFAAFGDGRSQQEWVYRRDPMCKGVFADASMIY